ncbi:MAG: hypothetical protein KDD56_01825 [Bdellovibrionales bacterium]|nr:hypothetical protein [Bdellovibrionales bacterium]
MAVLSSKYKITPQIIWNLFDQLQNEFLVAMPIDQYTADKKKELAQILLSESKPILFLAEDSFFLIRQSGSSTEIPTQSQAENYEFERAQSDLANCLDNITAEKRKFFTSFKYALELAKTLNPTLTKGDIPDVRTAYSLLRLRSVLAKHPAEDLHFTVMGTGSFYQPNFRRYFDLVSMIAEFSGKPQVAMWLKNLSAGFAIVDAETKVSDAAKTALTVEINGIKRQNNLFEPISAQLRNIEELQLELKNPNSLLSQIASARDQLLNDLESLNFYDLLEVLEWCGKFDDIASKLSMLDIPSTNGQSLSSSIASKLQISSEIRDLNWQFEKPTHIFKFCFLRIGEVLLKFTCEGFQAFAMNFHDIKNAYQIEPQLEIAAKEILIPNFLGELYFHTYCKSDSYSGIAHILKQRFA